jgi:ATP-dependent protease ClpP protease subunit
MPENLKNPPKAEENPDLGEKPAEILIYDVIGHDWWTGEGVTSKGIIKALEQVKTDKLVVRINSPGGDVFEGFAIYEAFKGFDGHIEMRVDSLAASAASFIAMAGDEIIMGEAAYLMIHDPFSGVIGTAEDMRAEADLLEKIAGTIAELYVNKTGSNLKDVKKLMRAETWMTADEAIDLGFADRKREEKSSKAMAFDLSKFVTTQVGEDPDAIGLYCISEEGIKGLPSKASLMASKTFLAFLRAVEI